MRRWKNGRIEKILIALRKVGSQLKHARSSMKNKDHLSIIKENVKYLKI